MRQNKTTLILALMILAILASVVHADGWTNQPSHGTLYSDTITSKTDASPVSIADSQGLFVTGYVTTLGKVGVGTTSPAAKLHVAAAQGLGSAPALVIGDASSKFSSLSIAGTSSSGTVHGHLILSSSAMDLGYGSVSDTGGVSAAIADNANAQFRVVKTSDGSNYNELVVVNNQGNVGIGTTDPGSYRLNVVAPTTGLQVQAGSTSGHIPFQVRNAATDSLFLVLGDGNVGIGVTTPSKKLSIGPNLHSSGDGMLIDGVIALAWGTNVPTPVTGIAYIWLDAGDGALKVKFSNGVVRTLATP